ncbi:hypothetical protein EKD16_25570 (plasmid) [Streptomonospora litoralis]|uniref:Uncharacterized protein n=2 Tax=Streptomonospora litoralis TaxID=2498135 RepID=A0A4P6QBA1_9ACTN|nr:hypothetical protein EKD16_25570 [Streptomonospora litoralis]
MARIRTVKPEFWSSPGTGSISPWARLLYIAMWNWADDTGRGTCNLRELQGFAFPLDEDAPISTLAGFRSALNEVRHQYGVQFYTVEGRPYYAIPSWRRHQRNERTAKSRYPSPSEGEEWNFMPRDQRSGGTSDTFRPSESEGGNGDAAPAAHAPPPTAEPTGEAGQPDPAPEEDDAGIRPPQMALELGVDGTSDAVRPRESEDGGSSGPGTGEQGNRGSSAPTERGGEPPTPPTAQTIVAEWLERTPSRPPGQVIGQMSKLIKQMLDEGVDPDDIRRGIATWMSKGLHPATLPSVVNEVINTVVAFPGGGRPSTTDQRVGDALELARKYAAQEAAEAAEGGTP